MPVAVDAQAGDAEDGWEALHEKLLGESLGPVAYAKPRALDREVSVLPSSRAVDLAL